MCVVRAEGRESNLVSENAHTHLEDGKRDGRESEKDGPAMNKLRRFFAFFVYFSHSILRESDRTGTLLSLSLL